MTAIIEVDRTGELRIAPELLGHASPGARYKLESQGEALILRPEAATASAWERSTPAERAKAFVDWARSHQAGPGLPDSAVGREGIYD